jgi:hypothetical protein
VKLISVPPPIKHKRSPNGTSVDRSGIINFYVDGNLYAGKRYTAHVYRRNFISEFKKMAKRETLIKHQYYYEIIPNIEP